MSERFPAIEPAHRDFIRAQHVFFVASAAPNARVNVSPKPASALRVLDEHRVAYLDQTGSGNETAAHCRADGRVTFLFCAFAGVPKILRLYGRGTVAKRGTPAYAELLARAFDDCEVVQTSCGYGVPLFAYAGERDTLTRWAAAKGDDALESYRRERNAASIDGLPT
jgi:hypothetical protein